MLGWSTVSVQRPPAPTGSGASSSIGALQPALPGDVSVRIQPASRQQVPDALLHVLYRMYMVYTPPGSFPDIRVQDRLVDSGDIDPITRQPATYIVRGRRGWGAHHLELLCERQATA